MKRLSLIIFSALVFGNMAASEPETVIPAPTKTEIRRQRIAIIAGSCVAAGVVAYLAGKYTNASGKLSDAAAAIDEKIAAASAQIADLAKKASENTATGLTATKEAISNHPYATASAGGVTLAAVCCADLAQGDKSLIKKTLLKMKKDTEKETVIAE